MTTNDETIFYEGMNDAKDAIVQTPQDPTDKRPSSRWQMATIGGVAGIVFGMAGTRAFDAFASSNTPQKSVQSDSASHETQEEPTTGTSVVVGEAPLATVDPNLSFGDAFAAARAQVGPGGVFLWHGQLYGTYYADEWNAMSDAERDQYAANVQPLAGQQTSYTTRPAEDTRQTEEDIHVSIEQEDDSPEPQPQVHFLGVETGELEGQTINVGLMTIDDVNVALVDVDNDMVFDVRIMDENRNGELEENEITDIHYQEITVDDFQTLSQLEQAMNADASLEQASNAHEDLAPDMPDYMNDADTGII